MDVRITWGALTTIFGLISLSQSSFITTFPLNHGTIITKRMIGSLVSVLLGFLVFYRNRLMQWGTRNLNLSPIFLTHSFFHAIVLVLAFFTKYSRFAARPINIKSCYSQYNQYSVGAFGLLALVLSLHSHKKLQLGLFSVVLSLIIDFCLEITSRYMFWVVLCCFGLFFLIGQIIKINNFIFIRYIFLFSFEVVLASVGAIFLFLSPFSEHHFKDADNLKGFIFITIAFFLGHFLSNAPNYINKIVETCDKIFLVKTMVQFCFLLIVSMFSFMNKYPIIDMGVEKGERHNIFDVFTVGSFSLLGLILRPYETETEKEKEVLRFCMLSFLIQLTMDTSIEIVLLSKDPNFLYLFGSGLYCFILILGKCYLDSRSSNLLSLEEMPTLKKGLEKGKELEEQRYLLPLKMVIQKCLRHHYKKQRKILKAKLMQIEKQELNNLSVKETESFLDKELEKRKINGDLISSSIREGYNRERLLEKELEKLTVLEKLEEFEKVEEFIELEKREEWEEFKRFERLEKYNKGRELEKVGEKFKRFERLEKYNKGKELEKERYDEGLSNLSLEEQVSIPERLLNKELVIIQGLSYSSPHKEKSIRERLLDQYLKQRREIDEKMEKLEDHSKQVKQLEQLEELARHLVKQSKREKEELEKLEKRKTKQYVDQLIKSARPYQASYNTSSPTLEEVQSSRKKIE